MRLFLRALAPLAILSTAACEMYPPVYTPADYAEDEAPEAEVTAQDITLPSSKEAIASWQLPVDSPWSRYEKLTLLTYLPDQPVTAQMEDVSTLDEVHRAEMAAAHIARSGLPANTMWVVDLHGAASVAFGATLSQMSKTPVAPVMTFNNWPSDNEVVPAEEALLALATMHPRRLAPEDASASPVFMLDSYRLANPYGTPDPAAIDNRYMLFPADFPDAATLKAQGITQVVYVVDTKTSSTTEQDDFHEVAMAYQAEGIEICLVDLSALRHYNDDSDPEVEPVAWDVWFPTYRFYIRERVTIFHDPVFYARARGGFGGVRAAPAGSVHRTYNFAHPSIAGSHGGGHMGGFHSSFGSHGSVGSHIGAGVGSSGHHFGGGGGRVYSGASPHISGHGGG